MWKKVKSYLVFTSFAYRIAMYLVVPVLAAAVGILGGRRIGGGILLVDVWLLTLAEVTADNWLFGGIQSKEADKLDYLRTSPQGMTLLRSALTVDLIRKFLSGAVILTVCYLTALSEWDRAHFGSVEIHICLLMLYYAATVLANVLARFSGGLWTTVMIGHVAGIFEILCCLLPGFARYAAVYAVLFGALGILASVVAVKAAMRRVEGNYYDA